MRIGIPAEPSRREIIRSGALAIAIAIAALGLAVPAALGEGRLAGSTEGPGQAGSYLDDDAVTAPVETALAPYRRTDAFDREAVVSGAALSAANESERVSVPSAGVPASSGEGVNWSQVGIGFLLGALLALGLVLTYRSTRQRTLAH